MADDLQITLPLLSAFDSATDIPRALLFRAQASGTHPHTVCRNGNGAVSDLAMGELGYALVSSSEQHDGSNQALYRSSDESVLVLVDTDGEYRRMVFAAHTREAAASAAAHLGGVFAVDPVPDNPDAVPLSFRWRGETGVQTSVRDIAGTRWDELRMNYPSGTRDLLDQLMSLDAAGGRTGRLVLFHGEPGTGKTTAVRALARAWSDWCETSCVVDPEVLFQSTDYLFRLVLDDSDIGRRRRGNRGDGCHLIVIEDVDELIQADAKHRTGQALSRLLNTSDGILGQGLDVVFLLTTNEPIGAIHPAVSRPGRCLANIEFTRFDAAEARRWLGSNEHVAGGGATLAELYSRRAAGVITGEQGETAGGGLYL
jgi:hypothetical protein